ncbi:MAG: SDR family oxidoreductase [Deltaproteobacteria bacterium]|nr:SDR family oxidoreductase [Deltaproteobacteria bacterium]
MRFPSDQWALILGGSSGFGLATAKKLAAHGLGIVIVHRDRRGAMKRITPEFESIRATGVPLVTFNTNALAAESRAGVIASIKETFGEAGRIRLLLHSIAFGNLKPLVQPLDNTDRQVLLERLAGELGVDAATIAGTVETLAKEGFPELHALARPADYGSATIDDEDLATTIYNMGTSVLSWVKDLLSAGLFAADSRVLGLTSEGNEIAWRGYAAVAAAKVAMESLSRSMALELAPYGVRSNIIQAGITETPASSLIPGIDGMKAQARLRNPFGRLTRTEDVANFIFLMCTDEAAWVNGSILRVDGGEHISGGGR